MTQTSIFAPNVDFEAQDKLDKWIVANPQAYTWICNAFVAHAEKYGWVSVRDIWGDARRHFKNVKRTDGSKFSFNNDRTPALADHLCEKYPQYASMVERRRLSADTENPSYG